MTPERTEQLRDDPHDIRAREVRELLDTAERDAKLRDAVEIAVAVYASMPTPTIGQWDWPVLKQYARAALESKGGES